MNLSSLLFPLSFYISSSRTGCVFCVGPKAFSSDPAFRRDTPYAANPYGAYSYSDNAIARIHNHSQTNGTRVLLFSDSFDNIMLPVLACAVTDVESIDLRHFKDDPVEYASTNRFDVAILFWSHP